MNHYRILIIFILTSFMAVLSCSKKQERPQDVFWNRLVELCGNAYPGGLVHRESGFDLLDGSELTVAYFRDCQGDTLKIPFHIEKEPGIWDRSRTWVLYRHAHTLEIRHDHRHDDGSEEENTWYGGISFHSGGNGFHEFDYPPRTAELGVPVGWRLEIQPGRRFTYGTMINSEWTFRVDFDLARTIDPPTIFW